MKTFRLICRTALPLILSAPCVALAQGPPAPSPGAPAAETPDEVSFSADQLVYDRNADIVTATGEVRMNREGYNLRSDSVSWNRGTGEVRAEGGVRITNPGGDVAYADSVRAGGYAEGRRRPEYADRACRRWPARGDRGDAAGRRHDPPPCRLHRLRGGLARRVPEGSDVADQCREGRARSGPSPHLLSRRDPEPVRHAGARPARPVAPGRQPGRRHRLPGARDTL